jgi:nucleoside-specific outer membrane channel protein Tsx
LAIANEQSTVDLGKAIDILQTIPYGTSVYDTAQSQIQTWQGWLSPPSVQYNSPSYDSYNNYDSYGGYDNYQEDYNSQPDEETSTSQPETVTPAPNPPAPELNKPITSSNKFID